MLPCLARSPEAGHPAVIDSPASAPASVLSPSCWQEGYFQVSRKYLLEEGYVLTGVCFFIKEEMCPRRLSAPERQDPMLGPAREGSWKVGRGPAPLAAPLAPASRSVLHILQPDECFKAPRVR